MSLVYAAVARNQSVMLCEFSGFTGRFENIAQELLNKLQSNSIQTITANKSCYYTLTSNSIHYLCYMDTNDTDIDKKVAMQFLTKLKEKVLEKYSYQTLLESITIPMQDDIKEMINEFNSKDPQDIISTTNITLKKLEALKDTMIDNIELLLNRNEALDELLIKTKKLEAISIMYTEDATKVKRKMIRRYIIYGVIIFFAVCLVAYIIVGIICGFTFSKCTHHKSSTIFEIL